MTGTSNPGREVAGVFRRINVDIGSIVKRDPGLAFVDAPEIASTTRNLIMQK